MSLNQDDISKLKDFFKDQELDEELSLYIEYDDTIGSLYGSIKKN